MCQMRDSCIQLVLKEQHLPPRVAEGVKGLRIAQSRGCVTQLCHVGRLPLYPVACLHSEAWALGHFLAGAGGGQRGAGFCHLSFHLKCRTHPFPGLTHKLSAINTCWLPRPAPCLPLCRESMWPFCSSFCLPVFVTDTEGSENSQQSKEQSEQGEW